MRRLTIRLLLFCSTLLPASAVPILDFSGGVPFLFADQTRGWAFSLSSAVTVTSLGWFDVGSDGLLDAHPVGIWDGAGNLLLSATVQAGSADPLVNGFRYNSALTGTPTLAAGSYVIGGRSGADDLVIFATATMLPAGTFLGTRTNSAASFSFPTTALPGQDDGYFGPNFQIAGVPEIDRRNATLPLALSLFALLTLVGRHSVALGR